MIPEALTLLRHCRLGEKKKLVSGITVYQSETMKISIQILLIFTFKYHRLAVVLGSHVET